MAKKKIKKLLKGLGVGAALLGAGKALMNKRDRNAMLNAADANEGFREMFIRPNMLDIAGRSRIKPRMMTPQDMANDSMFIDAMAAKGGRIMKTKKGGKAVKGFAKKKKQANRSKKK